MRSTILRLTALTTLFVLAIADLALAQAGGGSSGFGGGGGGGFSGGGGGGGFSGGGSGTGTGGGGGLFILILIVFVVGFVVLGGVIARVRWQRKVRARGALVATASAEAAEDDPYFEASSVAEWAQALFAQAQAAWDARDRERLAQIVGPDLMVEWGRRLDDFDRRGWHNRVAVMGTPLITYVGLTNRDDDSEDRVTVLIQAQLTSYVIDRNGFKIQRKENQSDVMALTEYWTLARGGEGWTVVSIESSAEGAHRLDEEIVASPWSDSRVADEALGELASADAIPDGFTTADLADLDFEGDARAHALDLSLADARFAPDVLEAAARRAVEGWAEAVDGADAPLERVATPEAVATLLYAGDASRKTRVVVRGPRVSRIAIEHVDVTTQPATMTVALEVFGRRYVEDRDTAAVVAGSKDGAQRFTERWTLALDGDPEVPWRLVKAAT